MNLTKLTLLIGTPRHGAVSESMEWMNYVFHLASVYTQARRGSGLLKALRTKLGQLPEEGCGVTRRWLTHSLTHPLSSTTRAVSCRQSCWRGRVFQAGAGPALRSPMEERSMQLG